MTKDLRELQKQERNIRKALDGMKYFLDHYDEEQSYQVEIRLQRLEELFQEFHSVRRRIELLTDDVDPAEEADVKETKEQRQARIDAVMAAKEAENVQIVMAIENSYYKLKAALTRLMPKPDLVGVRPDTRIVPQAVPVSASRVKLPEIRLPSFNGQLMEWVTFRDTFRSLIHHNQQLTAMDKFTYLRSSLMDEALQEINSVEMSEANYEVAWTTLEQRYENKKLIVKAHLDSLFAVDVMKKESYESLSKLVGDFEKHLLMLQKIGENTANWSTILVHMVCSRLDSATLRHWETHHNSKEVPTYANLIQFLRGHCSVLQSVAPVNSIPVQETRFKHGVSNAAVQSWNKCAFCGEAFHSAFRCIKFLKLKVPERYDIVRRNKLCLNCLSAGHQSKSCVKGSCHHCQQKHHSLLHNDSNQSVNSSVPSQENPSSANQQQHQTQSHNQSQFTPNQTSQPSTSALPITLSQNTQSLPTTNQTCPSQNTISLSVSTQNRTRDVLLSTAVVCVKDQYGATRLARALLDSCSQYCFISTSFCQKLKLQGFPDHLAVQGIGGSKSISRRKVNALILPRSGDISSYNESMSFYVLPELTATLPLRKVGTSQWNIPSSIVLADPQFSEPGPIDIIIGAEYYFDLLTDGRSKVSETGPTLQNTVFGWVMSGPIPIQSASPLQAVSYACTLADIQHLDQRSIHLAEESSYKAVVDETATLNCSASAVLPLPTKKFLVQQPGDPEAIAALEKGKFSSPSSKLSKLSPVSVDKILCVGGRLAQASVIACQKHPISLCHHHPLVMLANYNRKRSRCFRSRLIAIRDSLDSFASEQN